MDSRYVDEQFVQQYAGLWCYGAEVVNVGCTEGFYNTVVGAAIHLQSNPRVVIEQGCGIGRVSYELARAMPSAHVIGIDDSATMIKWANKLHKGTPGETVPLDLTACGFGHRTIMATCLPNLDFQVSDCMEPWQEPVDLIVSVNLFDRLAQPTEYISQCFEGLAPGGTIIMTTPLNWRDPHGWQQFPDEQSVLDTFQIHGFSIRKSMMGLIYREMLDARGNFSEFSSLLVIADKL